MKYSTPFRAGLLLAVLLAALAGCGQSGPLYLPDEAPAKKAGKTAMLSMEQPASHGRL